MTMNSVLEMSDMHKGLKFELKPILVTRIGVRLGGNLYVCGAILVMLFLLAMAAKLGEEER